MSTILTASAPSHLQAPWRHPRAVEETGSLDFETYSEGGYHFDETKRKWVGPKGAPKGKKGLPVIGAAAYSEHPSTEVFTMSYRLPGQAKRRWRPGLPLPQDLFDYLANGGVIQAHNAMFERLIWGNVCAVKYGFPLLIADPTSVAFYQLRCSAAKARVSALPGKLDKLAEVVRAETQKDPEGKALIERFSMPRNPTKADPRTRITRADDPERAERFDGYCDTDIGAEADAAGRVPDMTADELRFWLIDQEINWRGVAVDVGAVHDCIAILEQALEVYGLEFRRLTGATDQWVATDKDGGGEWRLVGGLEPTQVKATVDWLRARGVFLEKLDDEHVTEALTWSLQPVERRVLEIRQLVGSASVKKLFSMANRVSRDGRLRDLIIHHGARTGRPTGDGPQPLNLPKSGPDLRTCEVCDKPSALHHDDCPWCASPGRWVVKGGKTITEWNSPVMTDAVLAIMRSRDLRLVERFFGDAVLSICGVIRGLFVAGEGKEFICSDFSAIEAVVTAELSGCQWRIEAFKSKKDIYLASASKITGITYEAYVEYKTAHGSHHPDRQKIGKPAELGLGFGGWLTAWRQFDKSTTFTDEAVKTNIIGWRDASPEIVEFWGGQHRKPHWFKDRGAELYGLEGAALTAIQNPTQPVHYRGMTFRMVRTGQADDQRALKITLLSGRELTYHEPVLSTSPRDPAEWSITYRTWNSNPTMGPLGWVVMSTYGGRLCENVVQATAHDILRYAIENLRLAGYPCVLHIYDEILVEVPLGSGSIEEVERIMGTMPPWAQGWPIRASGGWRGKRFRKD